MGLDKNYSKLLGSEQTRRLLASRAILLLVFQNPAVANLIATPSPEHSGYLSDSTCIRGRKASARRFC